VSVASPSDSYAGKGVEIYGCEQIHAEIQEALTNAQNTATRFGHAELDVEHVLLALIEQQDGLVPRLMAKMDVPLPSFSAEVVKELERRPKVSGRGRSPARSLFPRGSAGSW
jgi:ATP-dependent Clp protease ATP-binding subunit ClpB